MFPHAPQPSVVQLVPSILKCFFKKNFTPEDARGAHTQMCTIICDDTGIDLPVLRPLPTWSYQ